VDAAQFQSLINAFKAANNGAEPTDVLFSREDWQEARRWFTEAMVPFLQYDITDLRIWGLRVTIHDGPTRVARPGSGHLIAIGDRIVLPPGNRYGLVVGFDPPNRRTFVQLEPPEQGVVPIVDVTYWRYNGPGSRAADLPPPSPPVAPQSRRQSQPRPRRETTPLDPARPSPIYEAWLAGQSSAPSVPPIRTATLEALDWSTPVRDVHVRPATDISSPQYYVAGDHIEVRVGNIWHDAVVLCRDAAGLITVVFNNAMERTFAVDELRTWSLIRRPDGSRRADWVHAIQAAIHNRPPTHDENGRELRSIQL
jgi:hypothetical protein